MAIELAILTRWFPAIAAPTISTWIDQNLELTTYEIGKRAIIVTFGDEHEWLLFKLRFCGSQGGILIAG